MRIWKAGPDSGIAFADVSPSLEAGGRLFPYVPSAQGTGVIEWQPGSWEVGDFVWAEGHGFVLIADRAERVLAASGVRGWTSLPIEMRQHPSVVKPQMPQRVAARNRRVWLPYEGPALREMHITRWVHLDRERSTYKRPLKSDEGAELLPPRGVEWYSVDGAGRRVQHPRRPDKGFFVSAEDLGGDSVFRCYEWPHVLLVTDAAKTVIEGGGLTNIEFVEYGEVIGRE